MSQPCAAAEAGHVTALLKLCMHTGILSLKDSDTQKAASKESDEYKFHASSPDDLIGHSRCTSACCQHHKKQRLTLQNYAAILLYKKQAASSKALYANKSCGGLTFTKLPAGL